MAFHVELLTLAALSLASGSGCDARGAHATPRASGAASSPAAEAARTSVPVAPAETCASACTSIERCGAGHCVPACPGGEVYVAPTPPEGFSMGAGLQTQGYMKGMKLRPGVKAFDTPHQVVLTRGFCLDALEVTAADYEKCQRDGVCTETAIARWSTLHRWPDQPINDVSWKQARAFCRHVGKDLPTEAQWEWAAKGSDGRQWPWGNERPTCARADFTPSDLPTPSANAGCNGGNASAVGSHPEGARHLPTGDLQDLAGNVWEWTIDNAEPYATEAPQIDPVVVTNEDHTHIIRGGGWNRSEVALRTTYRGSAVVGYQRPALGFRCARNP